MSKERKIFIAPVPENKPSNSLLIELDFHSTGDHSFEGLREYFACNDRAALLVKNSHMLESDNPDIVMLEKNEGAGLAEEVRSYYNKCGLKTHLLVNNGNGCQPAKPSILIESHSYSTGDHSFEGLREYFSCDRRASELIKNSHMLESDNPDIVTLEKNECTGLAEEFNSYYIECAHKVWPYDNGY